MQRVDTASTGTLRLTLAEVDFLLEVPQVLTFSASADAVNQHPSRCNYRPEFRAPMFIFLCAF